MLTLADLRARKILPVWQEAVAIVQELLDTTLTERRSASRLPDISHFALTAEGAIALLPDSPLPEDPVRHLAAILGVLLEGTPSPEPLFELVDRTLAIPPAHATAEAFSHELKYYERPDRTGDICNVVARGMDAPVPASVEDERRRLEALVAGLLAGHGGTRTMRHGADTGEPAANAPAKTSEVASDTSGVTYDVGPANRSWLGNAGMSLLIVSLVGIGVYVISADASSREDLLDTLIAPARRLLGAESSGASGNSHTPSAPAASPAARSAQAPTPGTGRLPSAPRGDPGVPVAPRTGGTRHTTEDRSADAARVHRDAPERAAPSSPSAETIPSGPAGGTSGDAAGESTDTSPPPAGVASAVVAPADTHVYSFEDASVAHPALLRPPSVVIAPPGVPALVFELLIGETGKVEQVHQISGETGVRASMLRASLKAWEFRPAMKDGRPVRYRLQVRLSA